MITNKSFQGSYISSFNYSGANLSGFTIFHSSNNGFAYCSPASQFLTLILVHIFPFAADEGFIGFNRTIKTR